MGLRCPPSRIGIDFLFSFDSLVHAEQDVIAAYLSQLARKLSPMASIHHSNIGAYPGRLAVLDHYFKLPPSFRRIVLTKDTISKLLSISLQASRARSMTAALFGEYCLQAGFDHTHFVGNSCAPKGAIRSRQNHRNKL
jgi:hypothetical protein